MAAGGTNTGFKGMMVAAKTLTGAAIDLFSEPQHIEQAWQELNSRRGASFVYKPMLGNWKPALDYRK